MLGDPDRRRFVQSAAAGMLGLSLPICRSVAQFTAPTTTPKPTPDYVRRIERAPRLFCTAYITPDAPGQSGQEATVSKYPLALVPQDMRGPFVKWRDRVRELNPDIILLGYQMVIEENMQPGPGNDALRKIRGESAYCSYPGGFVPTVIVPPSERRWRIFDTRDREWQERFLEACHSVLRSYPFDGLFLDNCTVYTRAHPLPGVREEMRGALQDVLLELRRENPHIPIVGNSSFHWHGLNGELCEGRPDDVSREIGAFSGHIEPIIDLVQARISTDADASALKRQMVVAHSRGAFFGAAVNYQHVLWPALFEAEARSRRQIGQ